MFSSLSVACALFAVAAAASAMTPFTLDDAVRAARADAARRAVVAPDRLVVIDSKAVTWSDGSLGCPQPGRYYTQALVPGYRIRLETPAGVVLDYHASTRGAVVFCEPGQALDPLPADPRI